MVDISDEYQARTQSVCQNAFQCSTNLSEALQSCEGLFPTLAIKQFFKIDPKQTQRWIDEAICDIETSTSQLELDPSFFLSTWEFCDSKIEKICSIAWNSKSRVCLLGAPTLVRNLPSISASNAHVIIDLRLKKDFLDGNRLFLSHDINILRGNEFASAFDVCFLDPPWYPESYIKWINVAGSYCRDGGKIAFSLLGSMTRPSAIDDRDEILDHCRSLGLTIKLYRNAILYKLPPFERAMLVRANIPPVSWKCADLVLACRVDWQGLSDEDTAPVNTIFSRQVRVAGLNFDIVFDRYVQDNSKLVKTPQHGYWMQTPSRREPGLHECNVFTSNGGRFVSPRPLELFVRLVELQQSSPDLVGEEIERLGFPSAIIEYERVSMNTN